MNTLGEYLPTGQEQNYETPAEEWQRIGLPYVDKCLFDCGLTSGQLMVFADICYQTQKRGGCYDHPDLIAERLGLSPRMVEYAQARFVAVELAVPSERPHRQAPAYRPVKKADGGRLMTVPHWLMKAGFNPHEFAQVLFVIRCQRTKRRMDGVCRYGLKKMRRFLRTKQKAFKQTLQHLAACHVFNCKPLPDGTTQITLNPPSRWQDSAQKGSSSTQKRHRSTQKRHSQKAILDAKSEPDVITCVSDVTKAMSVAIATPPVGGVPSPTPVFALKEKDCGRDQRPSDDQLNQFAYQHGIDDREMLSAFIAQEDRPVSGSARPSWEHWRKHLIAYSERWAEKFRAEAVTA